MLLLHRNLRGFLLMAILIAGAPAALASAAGAEDSAALVRKYSDMGRLIVTQMVSAPFPHPKRTEGHQYKDQMYSAADHYSDSTVAIFAPHGFRADESIDFVIYFHGWRNNVSNVLSRYKLIEQLVESRRNAILIVPQGPRDAPDSFDGKLEDAGGFARFMTEACAIIRANGMVKNKEFQIGRIGL